MADPRRSGLRRYLQIDRPGAAGGQGVAGPPRLARTFAMKPPNEIAGRPSRPGERRINRKENGVGRPDGSHAAHLEGQFDACPGRREDGRRHKKHPDEKRRGSRQNAKCGSDRHVQRIPLGRRHRRCFALRHVDNGAAFESPMIRSAHLIMGLVDDRHGQTTRELSRPPLGTWAPLPVITEDCPVSSSGCRISPLAPSRRRLLAGLVLICAAPVWRRPSTSIRAVHRRARDTRSNSASS